MAYIRIFCINCSQSHDIYSTNCTEPSANICPFCGARITRQLWETSVVTALEAVQEANKAISRDSRLKGAPKLVISILDDKPIRRRSDLWTETTREKDPSCQNGKLTR